MEGLLNSMLAVIAAVVFWWIVLKFFYIKSGQKSSNINKKKTKHRCYFNQDMYLNNLYRNNSDDLSPYKNQSNIKEEADPLRYGFEMDWLDKSLQDRAIDYMWNERDEKDL